MFMADSALDALLADVALATRTDICSQEPATYTQATSTYSLGSYTSSSWGAVQDHSPTGRERIRAAITTGATVSVSGTATHFAETRPADSSLKVAQSLSNGQAVTSGNPFTLTACTVSVGDPV